MIAQQEVDVPGWTPWSDAHSLIARELRGVDRANLKVFCQSLNGRTEATFRRSLLVVLCMHHLPFKDAETWLHDHDETPDRKEFTMSLIADDLFINFDDRRTVAGQHVLGDLSRSMQIVFLTHHDYLVPLAKEVLGPDLNVMRL